MNRIEKDINVTHYDIPERISYVQATNAIPLVFHIKDYDIPPGSTARVYVKRPDGTSEYDTASLSGNTVTVNVKKTMFSVVGNSRLQLRIAKGDEVLVSFEIIVEVRKNHADGGVQSENATDIFDEALKDLDEATKVAAVKAGEAAESARKADESYEKSKEIYENFSSSGDVTGVKGDAEKDYRTGKINITPENIGLTGINDLTKNLPRTFIASTNEEIENGLNNIISNMTDSSTGLNKFSIDTVGLKIPPYTYTCFTFRCSSKYAVQFLLTYSPGTPLVYVRSLNNGVSGQIYKLASASDIPSIINNLTTTEPGKGSLDAYQGKILKDESGYFKKMESVGNDVTKIIDLPPGAYEASSSAVSKLLDKPNGINGRAYLVVFNRTSSDDKSYMLFNPYTKKCFAGNLYGLSGGLQWKEIAYSDNTKSLTQFTEIPSGADLKSAAYLVPGNYVAPNDADIKTYTNCPVNIAFTLRVENSVNGYIQQTFETLVGNRVVKRLKSPSNWFDDSVYYASRGTPPANKLRGTDANGNVGWIDPVEMDFGSYPPATYNVHTAMKDILLNKVPKATRPRIILGAFSCGSSYSTVVQVSGVEGSCSAILFTYTGAAGMVVYQNKSGVVTYTSLIGSPVTIQ